MLNAQDGWARTTTYQLLRTADGGQTWIDRTPIELPIYLSSGFFLDAQTAWVSLSLQYSNRHGLLHTTDGGQTWSQYPYGPGGSLHFTDALNGWAIAGDVGAGNAFWYLSQTSDGGKTWSPILVTPPSPEPSLPPGTIVLCNICRDTFYYDPARMIIVNGDLEHPGGSVSMEVSFDLGQTWRDQNLPLPQAETDALVVPDMPTFFDEREGLLPVHLLKENPDYSYSEQRLIFYATQDGGASWSLLPGVLDAVSVYSFLQVVLSGDVYVKCGNALCASHDRARTWQTVSSDLDFTSTDTRSVNAIDFIDSRTGWVLIMDNEVTSLFHTTDGGVHWNLMTPLLVSAPPPTVTIDTSIPTPTLIPTRTLEPSPTPDVVYDPQANADRIRFAPYATWVELTGTISASEEKHYVLSAMQGQVMSVSVLQGPAYTVEVAQADKTPLSNDQYPQPYWRGTLPATQDYFVTLKSQVDGPFTLRIAINPPGRATQNFAFYDPQYNVALSYSDEFAPMQVQLPVSTIGTPLVTLFFIDPSYYYPATNLNEAGLVLSATSDPNMVATCTQPAVPSGETITGQETINGYVFTRSVFSGAAAGNRYDQVIYRTVWHDTCFELIYLIHSGNIGNYPPGTVVEFDREGLLAKFNAVLATFMAK